MKAYRLLLAFLALAFLAALAAWSIGDDPGYVLVQRGGWALETSLVFAVLALLALWAIAATVVWLMRFPLRAMANRARRRGRMQLARGAQALAEGRTQRAEQLLLGASRLRSLRIPALLAAYDAAHRRGEVRRQGDVLAALAATGEGETAATVLRAQAELEQGRAGTAIELLTPLDQAQRLPPAGVQALIEALAARGRARETFVLLARLRRAQAIAPAAMERLETLVLTQAIAQAGDGASLEAVWSELNRGQRREAPVALAYARRATALRSGGAAAVAEVESLLGKYWSDELAIAWARLPGDVEPRLRTAEKWLVERPNSPGLLLALGELCRVQSLWGKADTYLRRALGAGAGADAWEQLGLAYAAQNDNARAAHAFANALAARRGETVSEPPRGSIGELIAPIAIVEERNEMGVPRLPHGN